MAQLRPTSPKSNAILPDSRSHRFLRNPNTPLSSPNPRFNGLAIPSPPTTHFHHRPARRPRRSLLPRPPEAGKNPPQGMERPHLRRLQRHRSLPRPPLCRRRHRCPHLHPRAEPCVPGSTRPSGLPATPRGSRFVRSASTDVRDYEAVKRAVEEAEPVDVLIYNHGLFTPQDLEVQDLEEVGFILEVNLIGMFHLINAALPAMKRRTKETGLPASIANMLLQAGQVHIIMKEFYHKSLQKPAIFGMTASPLVRKGDVIYFDPRFSPFDLIRRYLGVHPPSDIKGDSFVKMTWLRGNFMDVDRIIEEEVVVVDEERICILIMIVFKT